MMRAVRHILRFRRNEHGGVMVEYGLVMSLLLLLLFGLIDFGRMGFSYVMAQKGTERAVRQAVVMEPVCADVPVQNDRGILTGDTEDLKYGASCSIDANLCAAQATVSCTAAIDTASAAAIWGEISPLLPSNATPSNLQFTYRFDPNLGFLGGPYTPLVTAELVNLDFEFATPLGALAAAAGATDANDVSNNFAFPSMSASLPAEALGRTRPEQAQ